MAASTLFSFSVDSIYGTLSPVANTAYSVSPRGRGFSRDDETDSQVENYGSTPHRGGGMIQGASVPEAGTLLLFSGLSAIGLLSLRRRKSSST